MAKNNYFDLELSWSVIWTTSNCRKITCSLDLSGLRLNIFVRNWFRMFPLFQVKYGCQWWLSKHLGSAGSASRRYLSGREQQRRQNFFLIVLHCIALCCTVLSRTTKGRLVSLNWNVRYPHRSHSNRSTSLLCFFKLVTNENGLSVNPLYVQFGGFAKRYAKKQLCSSYGNWLRWIYFS